MVVATNVDDKIREFVQLTGQNLKLEAVYLFGSQARGNAHEWSDIDLAIVSSDFCGDLFDDSKRLFPYILIYSKSIRPSKCIPFAPKSFRLIIHL